MTMTASTLKTQTRTHSGEYLVCAVCERVRIGRGARGWEAGEAVCPTCLAVIERARQIGALDDA